MQFGYSIAHICNKKKSLKNQRLLFVSRVELEGIEPSSAQGNHMLSTCLFQPSVFVLRQDLDLSLIHISEPTRPY